MMKKEELNTAVQHNRWSTLDHEGNTYRVRLVDRGFSYAGFQIQRQVGTRPRFFLWGSPVSRWRDLAPERTDYFPHEAFLRRDFYEAEWVKKKAVESIASWPPISPAHQERL